MGMKYPDFDWKKIIKEKPIETKTIRGKPKDLDTHLTAYEYDIEVYPSFIANYMSGRVKIDKTTQKETHESYAKKSVLDGGGYVGFVASNPNVLLTILEGCAKQEKGYIKDLDIIVNRLSGIDTEILTKDNIKFKEGGTVKNDGNTEIKRAYSSQELTGFLRKNGFKVATERTTSVRGYHDQTSGISTSKWVKRAKIYDKRISEVYQIVFHKEYADDEDKIKLAKELLIKEGYHLLTPRFKNQIPVEGRLVKQL